jgi:hypothetical protein
MKVIVTLFALFIGTSLALAAEGEKPKKPPGGGDKPRPNPEEMFKKLDSNADGTITKDEFNAGPMAKKDPERAAKMFGHKDKNKDDSLSKEEFMAHPEGGPGKPPGERPGPGKPPGDKPGPKPEKP